MNNDIISWIQERVRQRQYRLALHAELERYYDQRGPSALVLGFTKEGKPIHIVCVQGDRTMLVIITVYVPDENFWINYRKRKE